MLRLLRLLLAFTASLLRTRQNLLLEILALRQQLSVLTRRHPQPRLAAPDRLFWVVLRRLWPGWKQALLRIHPGKAILFADLIGC